VSQQINLYSPLFRKQTKVFSAATMLQGVGLMILVIAVFYYYMAAQSSLLELRAMQSGQQLASELERLKAYGVGDSPAERMKALAERKKMLEQKLAGQNESLEALKGSFGRADGYSELLRALARVSLDGVWLTRVSFAEGSGELSLVGRASRADLVPVYIERLRKDPALRSQGFSQLDMTRPAPAKDAPAYVEFVLSSGAETPRAK
jgi:Tfp pilus assembly protein PilN